MELNSQVSINNRVLQQKLFLSEIVMEAYLIDNPSVLKLKGYDVPRIQAFEVPWRKGDSSHGRIDLLLTYDKGTLAIAELKKGVLDRSAYDQLSSYFENKTYLENCPKRFEELDPEARFDWVGILVGTDLDSSLKAVLEDGLSLPDNIPLVIVLLDRYTDPDNQVLVFSKLLDFSKSKRPSVIYKLDGVEYGYSRFVLALVKKCISQEWNLSDLNKLMPDSISFSEKRPFITLYEQAIRINKDAGDNYIYFHKEEDAVTINDIKYAVTYGWSYRFMPTIYERAKSLGFNVEQIDSK